MILRGIHSRNGSTCLLDCGHTTKSNGKYKARCKKCESEGVSLVYSTSFGTHLFKTTETDHKECMDKLAAKCRWEWIPRLSVLLNYRNIICDECKKEIGLKKVNYEKI